jgi:signal transduction histidine kinase
MLEQVIRECRDELLAIARGQLQTRIPDRPEHEVVDHLPGIVDHITRELEVTTQGDVSDPGEISRVAADHGRQREHLGIDLANVAADYGSVCDAIAEVAKRHNLDVPAREWQTLNRALDISIAAAISSYQDQHDSKTRRETALHLGGIAHELRNSLSAVQAAFDVIKAGRVGVTSRTSEVLERQLKYLAGLANDLVGQSKLNAGMSLARENVHLGPFVEGVVAATRTRRQVRVETSVDPSVTVSADPQLLTSALTNLLQNAIKFTHDGGHVVVRGRREGAQALIQVEDQCGGLPDGQIDEMFAPFVQQSANRTGLGLGLWLVQQVMNAHAGSVGAHNIPGQGCVFTLTLPAEPS